MPLFIIAAIAVTGHLSWSQPRPAPHRGAAEPTHLRFGWPAGVTAIVETESSSEMWEGSSEIEKSFTRARYRMRVLDHREERRIRFERYERVEPAAGAGPVGADEPVDGIWTPSVIVDRQGSVLRIEDYAAIEAALEREWSRQPMDSPAERELAALLIPDRLLRHGVAKEWHALVGFWIGRELTPRKSDFVADEPDRLWPGKLRHAAGSVQMTGTSACGRTDRQHACATFERTSRTDQWLTPPPGITIDRTAVRDVTSDLVSVLRVTLETSTMLPHEWTRLDTAAISRTGEPPVTWTARKTVTFRYEAETGISGSRRAGPLNEPLLAAFAH